MVKSLAALALGIAIVLPASAASADDGNGFDRESIVAPVQISNAAPALPSDVWQVEAARDSQ